MVARRQGAQGAVRRDTVRRLRQRAGLQGVKKARQRRPGGGRTTTPPRAEPPQQVWRDDFGPDATTAGRRVKCLTVRDASTRAGLTMPGARSSPAGDVVQGLQRRCGQRGAPEYVQSDHGPECMAQQVTAWLPAHQVATHCMAPGRPWQYGQNERCNGVLRDGCLNRWLFAAVQEARRMITHWREEDNDERPHGALHGLTPRAFAAQCRQPLEHAA